MPYKDPDKQRKAQRKYEKNKRGVRGENWMFVIYPDSLPDDYLDVLEALHVPVLISPLHDADLNSDGEQKKPHYHVLVMFESLKSLEQMKEISDALNAPAPKKMDSKRGAARYLCHLDNPEKAQYEESEVKALSGADYLDVINAVSTEKYKVIREMQSFCREHSIVSFAGLMDYAADNNEQWFRALCDNSAYVMRCYLKSCQWEEK